MLLERGDMEFQYPHIIIGVKDKYLIFKKMSVGSHLREIDHTIRKEVVEEMLGIKITAKNLELLGDMNSCKDIIN